MTLEGPPLPAPVPARAKAKAKAKAHFASARLRAECQGEATGREVGHIRHALDGCHAPLVLLKGAAYLMAGLKTSPGRMF